MSLRLSMGPTRKTHVAIVAVHLEKYHTRPQAQGKARDRRPEYSGAVPIKTSVMMMRYTIRLPELLARIAAWRRAEPRSPNRCLLGGGVGVVGRC